MKKTVSFRRPPQQPAAEDAWVGAAGDTTLMPASPEQAILMKRLTIDLPEDLHRRVKRGCADRGVKMADIVRDLLANEFKP